MNQGSRTILVVEDEDSLRSLITQILKQEGYRVLEAREAEEAVIQSRAFPDPIDLLITDVVMDPFYSGVELAVQLRQLRPAIRVLYISGYLKKGLFTQTLEGSMDEFLAKPFELGALRDKVKALLFGSSILT